MKTYTQLERFEKAFNEFLLKIYKKSVIKIEYYQLRGESRKNQCAFLGYETTSGGLHGIHYNEQIRSYKFGTREQEGQSWITELNYREVSKIPSYIKDAFYEVAVSKKDKIIKIVKKGKDSLNEWT